MIKRSVLVFTVLFAFISCSKKDDGSIIDPIAEGVLTINIKESYKTDKTDNWLLIHDENGKLVDHKAFETGEKIIFKSPLLLDNKTTLTIASFTKSPQYTYYKLRSLLLTNISEEINLETPPELPSRDLTETGNYKLNLTDLPWGASYEITNSITFPFSPTTFTDQNSLTLKLNPRTYKNADDCFIYAADNNVNPRYKLLTGIKPGDDLTVSYKNMAEFDKNIVVNFPETNLEDIYYMVVRVGDSEMPTVSNYFMAYKALNFGNVQPNRKSKITLGYLNSFSNYVTSFSIKIGSQTYYYSKDGTAPTKVELPLKSKFELVDKSFKNFKFSTTSSYTYRSSSFTYFDANNHLNTDWTISAPSGSLPKITDLPTEFKTLYPEISIDNLVHQGSIITIDGANYNDAKNSLFSGKSVSKNRELHFVMVQ